MTYNHPVNRFVAGFIGMPPMNFFDGVVKLVDGQAVFEEGRSSPSAAGVRATANGPKGVAGGAKTAHPAVLGSVDELTLPGNGFRLPIPAHLTERLAGTGADGRRVVLGVRPEHYYLRPPPDGGVALPLTMRINVVEPLGNNMDVYLSTGLNDHVVARVEAQPSLRPESQVTLYVDLKRVHFFEPGETGMNLSQTSEPIHALA